MRWFKARSNCIIEAFKLWIGTRGRTWVAVRRSRWYRGLIPHMGNFRLHGRYAVHIEFVPRRRHRHEPKTLDNPVFFFKGFHRAYVYRKVGEGVGETRAEALDEAYRAARCAGQQGF